MSVDLKTLRALRAAVTSRIEEAVVGTGTPSTGRPALLYMDGDTLIAAEMRRPDAAYVAELLKAAPELLQAADELATVTAERDEARAQRDTDEATFDSIHRSGFRVGVIAAASVAREYNSSSTHELRIDDCILGKLNQATRKKPRKNPLRVVPHSDARERDAVTAGIATALADMHNGLIAAGEDKHLVSVARSHGVTLAECKRIGLLPSTIATLKRAGVK